MATNTVPTKQTHTAANNSSGNTSGTYSISFDYLDQTDVEVRVDNVLKTQTTHYTFPTKSSIQFTSGNFPALGATIEIKRNTDITTPKVDFEDGSVLTETDLDNNSKHLLFGMQETKEDTESLVSTFVSANAPTGISNGARWYDTVSGRTFVYYQDVDTAQWVEANPPFDATEAVTTASQVNFLPSGTGAVTRTVDSKLEDVVSVKDFGAKGDNSNDDTAELQAALNAAAGKTLLIPKGIYLISKTLIIPEGTRIVGSGKADVSEEDYTKGTVIKTTGSGNAQVWTDIASGNDTAQTPCLVAGGNGVYIENLTVLTDASHWSIGILYPCVKQCSISKVSMRGFTNACLYLDASRSNLNKPTVTDQAGTSVTIDCGTGMNEFYAEDFIFRSNTNGVSDFGIKIQGTTRDTSPTGIDYETPTDSTTQSAVDSAASGSNPFWVWGWGGASDIVFNSGRTSGISIDGALSTNVAKCIQGQRFIAVDSRVSTNGIEVNVDRATRVDFISGYGELNGKIKFSHRTGIINFLFTAYTGEVNYLNSGGSTTTHGTLGSTSIVDADNSNTLGLTVYTNDGFILSSKGKLKLTANTLSPEVNNAFTFGSTSKNFANIRTRKVEADNADLVLDSDNNKIAFFDGSTEGSISLDTNLVIDGKANETGLRFRASDIVPRDNGADADNAVDLGHPSTKRFRDAYIVNGVTSGSDGNEKQNIEETSATEKKVAVACKSLLKKFKRKDAVATKGDSARIHFGIIAQDLEDAFKAEGLDASSYGMFCKNTWTDETTGKEVTRLGIRYSELLAFIISSL